jgi:hydrogenase expression/formation protein HypC
MHIMALLTDINFAQVFSCLIDSSLTARGDLTIAAAGVNLMCLGIPMQIQSINGYTARCEAKGVQRDVSLFMLQEEALAIDDFVVVHVGYAIQKITPQEARSAWELYDQMLESPHA